jgi:hypothetical protein
MSRKKQRLTLAEKYLPSEPCSCEVCRSYCNRPGWWTVEEAARALDAGYGPRMMLEMAPGNTFGVLSPAFKGNEGDFSRELFSSQGCTFLKNGLCELHATGLEPLECRFCHHDRIGLGPKCHADIECDWNSAAGRDLVVRWGKTTDFWNKKRKLW